MAVTADEIQAEVLTLLSDPATHGGQSPRRIDTHISAVFLAGERAWKLKKAVRLPFLDFTSLASRRAACQTELEINRRAAPDLYLGVTPVTREASGKLVLNGAGEAVEWLVSMRRFDDDALLSTQVEQGKADRYLITALTETVWDSHRRAPVRADKGGAQAMAAVIDGNVQCLKAYPAILPPRIAQAWADGAAAWLTRLSATLDARRQRGLVRHCHGDLHCGNICVVEGRPLPFDAIEFSEDFACIDVFYDLAFLLMDLDRRGARALASYALNHYLDLSGDYEGVGLLPLFLSLRACVRAHVTAEKAKGYDGDEQRRLSREACGFLDAALSYLSPPPPRLLAVGGLSGSGKSRMGRELAPFLGVPGAVVVRSDALRKQLAGTPLLERLGPAGYTPHMTERTYAALYDSCRAVLQAGHAVVADAVFALPEQRDAIAQVARQAGTPFDALWLDSDPDLSAVRIAKRKANVSDATVDVLRRQLSYDLGAITWTRIDSSGSKDHTLALGRAALGLE